MNEGLIKELEAAAEIIMAPPNLVTNDQRHNAEYIFINFRKCKAPFAICRQILAEGRAPYAQFEAAETLKHALIREWHFLLEADKRSLRQFLLEHVTGGAPVPPFVRDRILQVIAIMVKRASVDDNGADRAALLHEIENIILNAEGEKKMLGFYLINNLMQEYATTIKSTDVGLPWELHFKAKKQFEAGDLKRIFQFSVSLLSELVKNDPPYPDNILILLKHVLQVAESVLTWGHISPLFPKRLIGIYETVHESNEAPVLRLAEHWAEIILAPPLIPLMFQAYWKVKEYEVLSHHAIGCLVQLASLNGGIMTSEAVRLEYLSNYMDNFSKLISSVNIKKRESLGVSNIVKRLFVSFIDDLPKLNEAVQDSALDEMTRLTCSFCQGAALEGSSADNEKYYSDALDNMLEAWISILQEYSSDSPRNIKEYAIRIFNTYLQYHLGPVDGARPPSTFNESHHQQIDIEDNEDCDRIAYKDQLQSIGMFGRIIPNHSLPMLYQLLESNTEKLKSVLQRMETQAMNVNESVSLDNLFEDLHWLMLIAGHVLCMDSDGETPMIPSEMMKHSIQTNGSELGASLNALATINDISCYPNDLERCDHIIRIVVDVLRLCVVETSAAVVKLGHFMSPEVSSTIMWFLKRWCLSYLLPVENYYQEISPILVGVVGKDTDGAVFVVNFILDKVYSNVCHFHAEPILLRDSIDLLTALVSIKQKHSLCIVKSKSLWNLITLQESLEPGRLPPHIRRDLFKSFVLAGQSLKDATDLNAYFDQTLTPLFTKFNTIIHHPEFRQNYQKDHIQKTLIDIFESFIGITRGAYNIQTIQSLFQFLIPILNELNAILSIYHNYQVIVQLILELFGQTAKNLLCYLSQPDSKKLYEATLATVRAYAKSNANKFAKDATQAEEDSFHDLALILDLLTYVLSKDCVDLCQDDQLVTVTASDVCLFGLEFVMPLMTLDLLKYPSLCTKFYSLLVLINDVYPEKIALLPAERFAQVLRTIELGVTQFGGEVSQACLDFVQGMAMHFFRSGAVGGERCAAMRPFLKLLLDVTLSHQLNAELIGSASTCIYALICCYEEEYGALVEGLVRGQEDALVGERLAAAFQALMARVQLNGERRAKLIFRDNFDRFIANVHGFLLVK